MGRLAEARLLKDFRTAGQPTQRRFPTFSEPVSTPPIVSGRTCSVNRQRLADAGRSGSGLAPQAPGYPCPQARRILAELVNSFRMMKPGAAPKEGPGLQAAPSGSQTSTRWSCRSSSAAWRPCRRSPTQGPARPSRSSRFHRTTPTPCRPWPGTGSSAKSTPRRRSCSAGWPRRSPATKTTPWAWAMPA
jgi:hypothetical protein